MAEMKTKPNDASVDAFLNSVADERKRQDCLALLEIMKDETGEEPRMWGDGIVGFGSYHYCYGSGREGDWFLTGFSPRKQQLVVYIMPGLAQFGDLLGKIGKHKTGVSCLYISRLAQIDISVLRRLIQESIAALQKES